jgi:hypothetical protein
MTRSASDSAQWTLVDEGLRAVLNVVGYLARKPEGA